jgi:restriction system protein
MGYSANRADLQRVGGTGDGGIDGVISLDKLGLEKVYVQAKRWQQTVGRPEVQAFYGALAGQRANKGVFITT